MEHIVSLELSCEKFELVMNPEASEEGLDNELWVSSEPDGGDTEGGAVMVRQVGQGETAGEG